MLSPIYTETTFCRDCYKCLRVCPVKAIKVTGGKASLVPERCIVCGRCVAECPTSSKKVRSDIVAARRLTENGERVFCSLAPSYVSEFPGEGDELLAALSILGFEGISETAIGAAIVSDAIDKYASAHGGKASWISTACPTVVESVKKYHKGAVKYLSPIPSPLQTHAAYLRRVYGDGIKVVFIGPCIAKKKEADLTPGYPDVALTFSELRAWLRDERISLPDMKGKEVPKFVPAKAGVSALYPMERGQITTSSLWGSSPFTEDALAASGTSALSAILDQVGDGMPFLELLSCEGGCINGPATNRTKSLAKKKNAIILNAKKRSEGGDLFAPPEDFVSEVLEKGYGIIGSEGPKDEGLVDGPFDEAEIKRTLFELGKDSAKDELNCGGCGYSSCREMAKAVLSGMAESEMCVTKMRREAQTKMDMLLRTIPNSVVIVDRNLNLVECNLNFLKLFSDMDFQTLGEEDVLNMAKGLPLERFLPFSGKFREEFNARMGETYRVRFKDKFLRITFFLVEKKRLLGAMFEDVTAQTVKGEAVVRKAEDVIQKSLQTVQQIASLLGENAADTEITLNSMIETFSMQSEGSEGGFFLDGDKEWK